MKFPLDFGEERVISDTEQAFGLRISSIEFFPFGESSWLYIAKIESGEKVVVKIQKELNEVATFVLEYLSKQNFVGVPKMIFAGDNLSAVKIGGYYYSVHQYIEPKVRMGANDKPGREYLINLGKLLKSLHLVPLSAEVKLKLPFEKFESSFYDYGEECINLVSELKDEQEAVLRVKEVLRKQDEKIKQIFANSKELGRELAKSEHSFNITHGDLHFGNIIEPANDHLYLIDWDCAMVALAEYDLMYFSDQQLGVISEGYGDDLLSRKTELKYYRCHLILRAFWFWINKALRASTAKEAAPIWDSFSEIIDDSPNFLRALS